MKNMINHALFHNDSWQVLHLTQDPGDEDMTSINETLVDINRIIDERNHVFRAVEDEDFPVFCLSLMD